MSTKSGGRSVLLVGAVAPALAVVPGPDCFLQEPGPLYDGSRVEFPLLEYLAAAPAYAESDSNSMGEKEPISTLADYVGETPAMIAGLLFFFGVVYPINRFRKKKGKTTIE